jgi:hypothetical protein
LSGVAWRRVASRRSKITFDSCAGLTDPAVATLARLPRLHQLRVSGMPRVTSGVIGAFPAGVTVSHSV